MCNNHIDDELLYKMRHSCAHLMAAAVQQIWPDAKFGVGPPTQNGFYYDIDIPHQLTPEDLPKIETMMRKLRKKKQKYYCREVNIDEAISFMSDQKQDYKVELLELLRDKGTTAILKETGDDGVVSDNPSGGASTVTFYQTGDFVDLCRGPHIDHSGQVGVFKLRSIAGAYWRGDSNNNQLQRIYGLCFADEEALKQCEWQLEQAAARDHRKIGNQLDIFAFSSDVGAGLPLWLPNGTVIREELEKYAKYEEYVDGYQRVMTPHITKQDLFYRSQHLPYYKDDMYAPIDIDGELYYLKPMNCPHHHQIYLNTRRSYRDLPFRICEFGQVYRYEASGGLSGLMRVRGFCQNDAHIYCTEDQAKEEFIKVMRLHARYYDLFGIKEYWMRLSLPDLDKLDKYVDDPESWLKALGIIREAMDESGYPYIEVEGEAAFYGPKVDFMIKSIIGTEYAISTNQLDFLAAKNFDLKYTTADGDTAPVYVIHRAPLGSHERFVAFLIEHYAGNFPVWLSPMQAVIIPIADRHFDYAETIKNKLLTSGIETATGGIRIEIDQSAERMQKKIRNAQLRKIPYMLVVGDQEQENQHIALRLRNGDDLGSIPIDDFIDRIAKDIRTRSDALSHINES